MLYMLALIVLMAWGIDYINGFHDTANAIATVVSTGVMSARNAILMAACLNFGGALLGTHVATTIASGLADPHLIVPEVIIAALTAAILWDLGTWYFGIPSSTSHTLMGGLAGAVVAHAGRGRPAPAQAGGDRRLHHHLAGARLHRGHGPDPAHPAHLPADGPARVNVAFRKLQLLSASAMAFTHGTERRPEGHGGDLPGPDHVRQAGRGRRATWWPCPCG